MVAFLHMWFEKHWLLSDSPGVTRNSIFATIYLYEIMLLSHHLSKKKCYSRRNLGAYMGISFLFDTRHKTLCKESSNYPNFPIVLFHKRYFANILLVGVFCHVFSVMWKLINSSRIQF